MRNSLVLLLAAFCLNLQAQRSQPTPNENITLTGTVLDQDSGRPLEYATLVLQSSEDPSKVTGGITDLDLKLKLPAAPTIFA